jgi:hypothetical protein
LFFHCGYFSNAWMAKRFCRSSGSTRRFRACDLGFRQTCACRFFSGPFSNLHQTSPALHHGLNESNFSIMSNVSERSGLFIPVPKLMGRAFNANFSGNVTCVQTNEPPCITNWRALRIEWREWRMNPAQRFAMIKS